ncbi:MAG TPA: hypothetical protein VN773_07265 [Verrucomicrobiae bacterium]|nr:hypothetical protein [Verrucomicrobiae bacterium]
MPSKKVTAEATGPEPVAIAAHSSRVVLAYVGDGRSARNAPPHDLTENDLARLAYIERLRPVANEIGQPIDREDPDSPLFSRPDPRDPDAAHVAEIVAELVASGHFSDEVPEPDAPATEDPPTTPEPDAPATEPEG